MCSQAFSVLDPAKNGAADMATLKRFMKQLHNIEVGQLSALYLVLWNAGAVKLSDLDCVYAGLTQHLLSVTSVHAWPVNHTSWSVGQRAVLHNKHSNCAHYGAAVVVSVRQSQPPAK